MNLLYIHIYFLFIYEEERDHMLLWKEMHSV